MENIISKRGTNRYMLREHDVVSRLCGTQLKKAGEKAVKGTAGEIVTNGEAWVGLTELPNRLCLQGRSAMSRSHFQNSAWSLGDSVLEGKSSTPVILFLY